MENIDKTKEQLIQELKALRRRVTELEKLEAERKRVEEALRESEGFSSSLLTNSPHPMLVINPDTSVRYVNSALERLTGFSSVEIIGRKAPYPWWTEETLQKTRRDLEEAMVKGAKRLKELFQRKDGERFWVEITSTPVMHNGQFRYYLANWLDITERKQVEEKITQAAEEWRTTFDSITDLVSIHDKDFRLTRVNKAFADTFNMKPKELIGKACYEIVHGTNEPVPDCPHKATIETKEPATAELFEPHLGIHLEVTTSPIFNEKGEVVASVHVARDITERKRTEEQLIVTDRLASIGELASGIAHELNNPLTSIIGFSQLLLDKDISDDVKNDLKIIYSEARRTAEVVKSLLIFARKHAPLKQLVNINSIIEKVLELRAYEQKVNNVQVNTRFAPDLPAIMADYFQLQQVFLNIVINAEHFMLEAHHRGTLTITTERVGKTIKASFTDDGPGISKKNLGHVFDPFFTTKEIGKGTGLGLSICHGIIAEHGGRLYAESKLGKGATFIVELPISDH